MQVQLIDPRIMQSIYAKPASSVQFKTTQSLHPSYIGSNGWFSWLPVEPNSMFAVFILTAVIAGAGVIYRSVSRVLDLFGRANVWITKRGESMKQTAASAEPETATSAHRAATRGHQPSVRSHQPRQIHQSTRTQHGEQSERDYEFLPPRERVIDLIGENEGKMYQQDIVEAMDRSASTVSRYLAKLESENRITRLRDRRENIVMLTGEAYDWPWEPSKSHKK